MTNEKIILLESVKLMKEGVLKPTDEKIIVEYEGGRKEELQVPEPIHTFNGWKERGYSVKKGEKSKIKFAIWKYTAKKIEVENKNGKKEEAEKKKMFLKMSAFFHRRTSRKNKGVIQHGKTRIFSDKGKRKKQV